MTAPCRHPGEAAPWFDPDWLIRRTLAQGAREPEAVARDALLCWMLRLPDSRDPAEAAARVLHAYRPVAPTRDPLARRLFALLDETCGYTRTRLAAMPVSRRRGGRRSRRPDGGDRVHIA